MADRIWQLGWPWHAAKRHRQVRFVATDVDWGVGEGSEVRGPIRAIALFLAGREVVTGQPAGWPGDR